MDTNTKIVKKIIEDFSMDGKVEVSFNVRDDSETIVQNQINGLYSESNFNKYRSMIRSRKANYYGRTDKWLYKALEKYPIKDKAVLIMGSTAPWYEAVSIEFGASRCDVVEYSPRKSMDSRVEYFTPDNLRSGEYDAIISISSFEHDGLGRYGDPIDVNGDLRAMDKCRRFLRPGGDLFLSVPVGSDQIVFNAHRIYGRVRLPLLLSGWEIKKVFGGGLITRWMSRRANSKASTPYQPIFVLKDAKDNINASN